MKKEILPLTIGGLGIGITEFVIMGLLPDIAKNLNISIPEAGHLISAYAIGVVIGAPLLILLGGRYPPKKILMALMVIFITFNALSVLASSYTVLFIARLLSGLPHGAFFGVATVVASRIADKGKAAQTVALVFMGLTLANIVGVPLGTFVGHAFSWRASFVLVVGVGIISLITIKMWIPEVEADQQHDIGKVLKFFRIKNAWITMFIISIGFGGLFSWFSYITPLMTEISHFSERSIAYILMLAGFGMLVGNVLGGKLADKYSPAKTTAVILIIMVVALTIIHFISSSQPASLLMTFILGAAAFALIPIIQILIIQVAPESEMLAASVSQACFNIANALGAFLGGLPLILGFNFAWPALVGAAMSLIGVAFAFWLSRRTSRV